MSSFAKKVRMAIESEFPGAQPDAAVWERIRVTLPGPAAGGVHRTAAWRLLPGTAAVVLVLSLAGVGLANTSLGRDAIDWAFGRFGIRLAVATPGRVALTTSEARLKAGPQVTEGVDVPWQGYRRLQAMLPTGMALPTYMPAGFADNPRVNVNNWRSGAAVNFARSNQEVSIMYHSSAFPRGSVTGTDGEAVDVEEIKINDRPALAYRDNSGWHITWALYGHQYEVRTNISLQEAVKVAQSIR